MEAELLKFLKHLFGNELYKYMKKLFLLSLVIVSLTAMWCKKSDTTFYTPLSQEFLSYFAFPTGCWWVYKEINTGKTDSFYVERFNIENQSDPKGGANHQSLIYNLNGGKYYSHGGGGATYSKKSDTSIEYSYVESYYGVNGFYYSSQRFLYPAWPGKQGSVLNISKHFDSINIQGSFYHDVYSSGYTSQAYLNPIKAEYYCKNVGVIRREFYDGTIWELTKYHLNK